MAFFAHSVFHHRSLQQSPQSPGTGLGHFSSIYDNWGRCFGTHSSDLLRDEGIAADEVFLFKPSREGTEVEVGADIVEVCVLLEAGLMAADAVIPRTRPQNIEQLPFL